MHGEMVARIDALYESGVPFFTKERIHEVYEQLKQNNKFGTKVAVKGLDGNYYYFELHTGKTFQPSRTIYPDGTIEKWNDNLEEFTLDPEVSYRAVELLKKSSNMDYPYCSIGVVHHIVQRDKVTKAWVNAKPAQSLDEAKSCFQARIQTWSSSLPCKELVSLLESTPIPRVDKIIAFACGTLRNGVRSAVQHALILTLRDEISKRSGNHSIQCYAQDPAYNEIDQLVLRDFGITVLPNPEGFLEADNTTVVTSHSPNVPVRQVICDLAKPAMAIWDKVGEEGAEIPETTDSDSSRLRKWTKEFYDIFHLPGTEEHFGHPVMYVRKSAEVDEEPCLKEDTKKFRQ